MDTWETHLRDASHEIEAMSYEVAQERLERVLDETQSVQTGQAGRLRPITLGLLAECYFQEGHAELAVKSYEVALEGCRAIGDADGIVAYLDNLYETHRYLGDGAAASTYAGELATIFAMAGRDADARRMQRRAALAKAGEPKNRVIATLADGSLAELEDVQPGRIRFSFQRNRVALRRAQAAVEEGERLGAAGKLDEALAKFQAAAAIDTYFPHPHYQAGFTLVLLRRYEEAVAAYRTTEELGPGWFHCRADLWFAEQLATGKLDHATFEAMRELEDGRAEPEAKLAIADRAIASTPHVAGLHLERGRQLAVLGRADDARDALRKGLSLDGDVDIRTRTLVQLAILTEDKTERAALCDEAIRLDGNLVAAATARLVQLTQ